MDKNLTSRTLTGGLIVVVGFVFMGFSIYLNTLMPFVYGIPIILLGLYIFFNRNEDKIEKRKDLKPERRRK